MLEYCFLKIKFSLIDWWKACLIDYTLYWIPNTLVDYKWIHFSIFIILIHNRVTHSLAGFNNKMMPRVLYEFSYCSTKYFRGVIWCTNFGLFKIYFFHIKTGTCVVSILHENHNPGNHNFSSLQQDLQTFKQKPTN